MGSSDATAEPDASPEWVTATKSPVGAGPSPGIINVDLLALAPSELLTQITSLWGVFVCLQEESWPGGAASGGLAQMFVM